ncbi:MAG: 4-hydroxy-3-methylbut-2-enyl diphosphate reductase [Candidatus Aminicenantes bacterium]|nr:4-hydroxy-3-methylbut-2-enyl diphosphate reductase [Candidatus Aminicenantes bacterium]
MFITLSHNLSYCFGVERTLTLVEELLEQNPGMKYYMLGEIVHNEHVINDLKSKGLQVIPDLEQIEAEGTVIIQSHGTAKKILETLKTRKIDYIDATCPMVKKIHREIGKLEAAGYFPVIIGKQGHDKVQGIAGQVKEALIIGSAPDVNPDDFSGRKKVGIVVQSTYIRAEALAILEKINALVPEVKFIDTICRPTTERQTEVEGIAGKYDFILIIGSKASANTRHLYMLAGGTKSRVYLVDDPESTRALPIPPEATVFIASGASTPKHLIEKVVSILNQKGS